jgi:protein-disulfide isomerase
MSSDALPLERKKSMNRRSLFRLALIAACVSASSAAHAEVNVEAILDDPTAPGGGNPLGDVTIVAFLDYNCPFCKKSAPDLARFARDDGHVRIVFKDWPILGEASVVGAKMALAARYQGRYEAAHAALMAVPGRRNPGEKMTEALVRAGLDMTRLQADLDAHDAEITALLKRNLEQADSIGLRGTPVFLIGPYKIEQALDYDGFKTVVARLRDARKPAR